MGTALLRKPSLWERTGHVAAFQGRERVKLSKNLDSIFKWGSYINKDYLCPTDICRSRICFSKNIK